MMHRVIAIGRLGRDPYTHTTKNGNTFTTFTVATDGSGKKTTWFKVKTWGKLAETCGRYLSKGRLVYVEGTVDVDLWHDKEGNERVDLILNARTVKFLDGNGNKAEADVENKDEAQAEPVEEPSEPEPAPAPVAATVTDEAVAEEAEQAWDDDFDFDDLPF